LNSQKTVLLLLIGIIFLTAGCASVSVGNIHPKGAAPGKLPSKIYVREFDAPPENFHANREGKALAAFISKERHSLAVALAAQLTKYVAPAEVLGDGKTAPQGNYWILNGTFDRVNQGSRILRTGVGFGAGGTKYETRAKVSDLSGRTPRPFLSMLTTGGSGLAPGAWAAFTPAFVFFWPGAIANAGGASLGGVSSDRGRTAREITATLSEYCLQHGLLAERKTRRPKKLGKLPPLQRPDIIVPKGGL
jgi:hypothetical protein